MEKNQQRASFLNSPVMERREQEGYENYEQETFSANGCCCFKFFKWSQPNNEAQSLLNQREVAEQRETWLVTKLKEVKETSEIIAGPKWKNFIRKISGYVNNKRKQRNGQFQYSPQSYALNFDGGFESEDEYDYGNFNSDMNSNSSSATATVSQNRHENRL